MIVLSLLDLLAAFTQRDAAFEAGIATTAIAGQHFNAVECRHEVPLNAAGVESFGALQSTVDVDQHAFERFEIKAAQAITQSVVAKRPLGADPLLQIGVLEIGLQLRSEERRVGKECRS